MREDGQSQTTFERAARYLQGKVPAFSEEQEDYSLLFVKLVMFYQLARGFGWDSFKAMHKRVRRDPLAQDATQQAQIDCFIENYCAAGQRNLLGFFDKWNLQASKTARLRIAALGYVEPENDPSLIFS
jgi:hypothetical protein